jgi:hypothetical protein
VKKIMYPEFWNFYRPLKQMKTRYINKDVMGVQFVVDVLLVSSKLSIFNGSDALLREAPTKPGHSFMF